MALLLVHGGATNLTSSPLNDSKQGATEASCNGTDMTGKSATDIVEAAVMAQELEPSLNAGLGSVVQMDGRIRMDAGICNSDGKYGAVMQIEHVKTPVRVARRVMDIGYHSVLSGDGAHTFAKEQGFESQSPFTADAFDAYLKTRAQFPALDYNALTVNVDDINVRKLGTVGAVAIDDEGRLAAACSTGGTKFCFPGRVGDSPVFGAGLYCTPEIAVCLTGEGDKILRRLTAKRVEERFLQHGNLKKAVDEAVEDVLKIENGYCGIIAIARDGTAASGHSTSFMAFAQRSS
ncbi:MAG: isoaspartyl peptidase/L-asparaginase [Alphaproteobacteria bacterium]|nr:isoaspartyl peptidase/L-asparaginase [Alphaproteobacteria bacterium]